MQVPTASEESIGHPCSSVKKVCEPPELGVENRSSGRAVLVYFSSSESLSNSVKL